MPGYRPEEELCVARKRVSLTNRSWSNKRLCSCADLSSKKALAYSALNQSSVSYSIITTAENDQSKVPSDLAAQGAGWVNLSLTLSGHMEHFDNTMTFGGCGWQFWDLEPTQKHWDEWQTYTGPVLMPGHARDKPLQIGIDSCKKTTGSHRQVHRFQDSLHVQPQGNKLATCSPAEHQGRKPF
ncbi:hypothetical protein UY3_09098 [Chelonia mydas]|uniref:Uncharacterized protein n=1 Tax=Chelonia mydas TaxID=8469 RepID=M7B9I7_CHEMY|nr:hypothetical protein UY3_09098 [Chelonia mydas]